MMCSKINTFDVSPRSGLGAKSGVYGMGRGAMQHYYKVSGGGGQEATAPHTALHVADAQL